MRQNARLWRCSRPAARLAAHAVAVLCALFPSRSHAQTEALAIEAGECPAEALVREQLEPLLAGEGLTADGAEAATGQRARVDDLGEQYRIRIGSERRDVRDPARDCLERARVAAVFIALNLRPEPAAVLAAPLSPNSHASAPVPTAAREPRPHGPRWGAQVFLETAYAPAASLVTTGPGLGVTLRGSAWAGALSGAILLPAELELEPGTTSAGAVAIIRAPFALTLTPLWRRGPLEGGPFAGIGLDVLSFKGERLERTESALRANVGGCLGLGGRWLLSRKWWAFANLAATAFPMEYRLRVEPTGSLGQTPRIWLGVSLGVGGGQAP